MKAAERRAWLLREIAASPDPLDILDASFVTAYIDHTGAPHAYQPYGAAKCPTLGRDLADLYRRGLLARQPVGIPCGEWGFPRWVYAYSLSDVGLAPEKEK